MFSLLGELIIGTRDIDSRWCMGRTSSKNGIFPMTHTWELDTTLIKVERRKRLYSTYVSADC